MCAHIFDERMHERGVLNLGDLCTLRSGQKFFSKNRTVNEHERKRHIRRSSKPACHVKSLLFDFTFRFFEQRCRTLIYITTILYISVSACTVKEKLIMNLCLYTYIHTISHCTCCMSIYITPY